MQSSEKSPKEKKINLRSLHVSVKKKAGIIKASSKRWLERHLNDPYVRQAKIDGYRSRAAYKLIEIDKQYGLFKKGQKVIDLGAAPGGWSQVCVERVCSKSDNPTVIGLDCLPIDPLPGTFMLKMNLLDEIPIQRLLEKLGGKPDLVLSDMAAPTIGHRYTDHLRTINLCEMATNFATSVLKSGGHFLTKTFQGGAEGTLLSILKKKFSSVHHVKPPSSRIESVELYLLAKYFRK